MKFDFTEYVTNKNDYLLTTKCGYKVVDIQVLNYGSHGRGLVGEIINSDGNNKMFLYEFDGKLQESKVNTLAGLEDLVWKVNKYDLELVLHKVERKWFNTRIGLYGNIESSSAYDSMEDAIKYKLMSDTDTICVITKIYDDEENGKTC